MTAATDTGGERELVLTRLIDAPREKVYRAFTEAELLKQWFAPLPWTITEAELDVRAGGTNRFVMRSPEGELYPNQASIWKSCRTRRSSSPMPLRKPGSRPRSRS